MRGYFRKDPKIYAVYDSKDNFLAEGTRYEIAEKLGWSRQLFATHLSCTKQGKPRGRIVIELEDDEE